MSATIVWNINSLLCKKQEDGEDDVVYQVAYSCIATEEVSGTEYVATVNSGIDIPFTSGTFTPYDQLTKDQVLGWVWSNGVEKDKVEAALQVQLQSQINPPDVKPPIPWE
jgi:hypothetical protein